MKLVAPVHLTDEIKAIWEEMLPAVSWRIGVIGMEALCVQVARMRDAQRRITEEGLVVADARGNAMQHPALTIERAAHAEVRQWIQKFGASTR